MHRRMVYTRLILSTAALLTFTSHASFAQAPAPAASAEPVTAPDFAFASTPYGWRHLHDLCKAGPVLLVFGADDAALATIQKQRERWETLSIEPVVVLGASDGANWQTLERLGLTYSLLSDPSGYVALQFGISSADQKAAPAWCLVDQRLRIRHLEPGDPSAQELEGLATLLGEDSPVAAARDGSR